MTCPRVKFQLNFRMLHPQHEVRTDINHVIINSGCKTKIGFLGRTYMTNTFYLILWRMLWTVRWSAKTVMTAHSFPTEPSKEPY